MVNLELKVCCGTRSAKNIEFNISDHDGWIGTSASDDEKRKALHLLDKVMNDVTFANDGERNEDAVNGCIALHVLGYDPEEWFDNFFDVHNNGEFFQCDVNRFMEHVERVCKYLYKWGPSGNEGAALAYQI